MKESQAKNGALQAYLEALANDPYVKQLIREGDEDLAAKPSRSTVYATKEDFIRAFS